MKKIIYFFFCIFLFASCKKDYSFSDVVETVKLNDTQKSILCIRNMGNKTQFRLLKLAEISILNNKSGKIIIELCKQGLPLNSTISYESSKLSLLYYAIEKEDSDLLDFLIDENLDPLDICYINNEQKFNGLQYCVYRDKYNVYLRLIANLRNIASEKLVNTLITIFYFSKSNDYIESFLSNSEVIKNLSNDEELVPFFAMEYCNPKIKNLTKYFDMSSLNFSNQSECLKCSILSGDLDCVKWIIQNGVPANIIIYDFLDKGYTPVEFVEYLKHRIQYGENIDIEKVNQLQVIENYLKKIQ